MNSRDQILAAVKANQPAPSALPDLDSFSAPRAVGIDAFRKVAETMGSRVLNISSEADMPALIKEYFSDMPLIVSADPGIAAHCPPPVANWKEGDGRQLQEVDLAIVRAQLGVAENGALWVTEAEMQVRVLPFIAQHLAIVLQADTILPTMHHAYDKIGEPSTGFGVFIAGPSKTADIEQSLVLGAHGAKSLTIIIIGA
jgi:L-lactate dehydrogenase complex protein LldG